MLKSTFSWLQLCRYLHSFSCKLLPLKFAKSREILRKFELSGSRSSKVIDVGANRKHICDFLLVIIGNFGCISYRFRDIDV